MPSLLFPQQPFPLIVLDLEWNQGYGKQRDTQDELPQEIVEIGAVRIDTTLSIVAEFHCTVRPTVHPVLHHHVRRVTGMANRDCRHGISFVDACAQLMAFCGDYFTLCTWGPDDYGVLEKNLMHWQLPQDWVPLPFNAQMAFSHLASATPGQQIALTTAMAALSIEQEDERPLHRAQNDAYYTAIILQQLYALAQDLPEDDPRLQALHQGILQQGLRYTARTTTTPTVFRSVPALLRAGDPPLPACPVCGEGLHNPTPCLRLGNIQRLEQLANCPEHGGIWIRYALEYALEGYICIKAKAMLTTPEQAAAFRQQCEGKASTSLRRNIANWTPRTSTK